MVEQRMAKATSVACLLTVVIACTSQADRSADTTQNPKHAGQQLTHTDAGHPPTGADAGSGPPGIDQPPPVTVHYGTHQLVLHPYTWCYRSTCADGVPPRR